MITSKAAHFLLYSIIIFIIVSSFALAQGIGRLNEADNKIPEVELIYCKGQSIFPVLLTTGQIDGYVGWQPELALAEVSGIGKVVSFSQDFPPNGKWHNHPCCVLVARALSLEPSILLMDEPCSALDPQTRVQIQADILRIQEKTAKAVVLVTHSVEEALILSDELIILSSRPGRAKGLTKVGLGWPRDRMNPRFLEMKETVLANLNGGDQ